MSSERMELSIGGRQISVFGGAPAGAPIVYLNTVDGEGGEVWEACQRAGCPPFTLAAISKLRWNHDMSPWENPPIAPGDTPCTGGADAYLALLTKELIPAAESVLPGEPSCRALAGYSLAGLFALYAMYRTDRFSRFASISGSLWFPGFPEFALSGERRAAVSRLYLSLGDREARTRNPYLKTVRENTEALAAHFREQGIDTALEWNPGSHFRQPNERTAAGIAWILREGEGAGPE